MKEKQRSVTILGTRIEQKIFFIRGKKIMIDKDLAELYEVPTKRLNEQVKRNLQRFPDDFMFQLSRRELNEVVANCDHLKGIKFSHTLPYAFTEHGILMISSVLNSNKAIAVNIQIMRTFTKLRELMIAHKDLNDRINALEGKYDRQFKVVFDTIRKLLMPPPAAKKLPIEFHVRSTEETTLPDQNLRSQASKQKGRSLER